MIRKYKVTKSLQSPTTLEHTMEVRWKPLSSPEGPRIAVDPVPLNIALGADLMEVSAPVDDPMDVNSPSVGSIDDPLVPSKVLPGFQLFGPSHKHSGFVIRSSHILSLSISLIPYPIPTQCVTT